MRASLLIAAACLAACSSPREQIAQPPTIESTPSTEPASSVATGAPPLSTPVVPPFSTANATPVDMPSPVSTGPSRETLCERALLDLELAAAPAIDKCVGKKPGSNQPITINVRIDESGSIAETKWDVSTTTGYGEKAASCILAAVKALPFAEPACAKEWLLVRRTMAVRRLPDVFDSRF